MPRHDRGAPRAGREPSQRQLRIGELIRHILADALARGAVHDPGLAGVPVTVTEVRLSPDLRNAAVFVLPLGGAGTDEALAALGRAAPFLRRLIGEQATMRHLPSLRFEADTGFEAGARLDRLLDSEPVRRDVESAGDDEPAPHDDKADHGP